MLEERIILLEPPIDNPLLPAVDGHDLPVAMVGDPHSSDRQR